MFYLFILISVDIWNEYEFSNMNEKTVTDGNHPTDAENKWFGDDSQLTDVLIEI